MDQNKTPLFDALKAYHGSGVVPFDVPGHKRGAGLPELAAFYGNTMLEADVNSMKCLDYLGNPVSVIAEAEALLADAYGADHGYFLVNGTSGGVQAMIMAACKPGDKIILPRNAHKSATNGLIASGAMPVYIHPHYHGVLGIALGITADAVAEAIAANPDAKAVFVINPTYFGCTSELEKIVQISHEAGMMVLVDEAHGAHFHFHDQMPLSAMAAGADMAAVSLHKTGGSLTQSSGLVLQGNRVSPKYLRNVITLNQTTSASYLLMTSLDVTRKNLATRGGAMLEHVLALSRYARTQINGIPGLRAPGPEMAGQEGIYSFDESKLLIDVTDLGISGFVAYDLLRDNHKIQMELGESSSVLAIISVGDTKASIDALIKALQDLSDTFEPDHKCSIVVERPEAVEVVMTPREAFYADKKTVHVHHALGCISGESVMVYPPGIPVVTPGERITTEVLRYMNYIRNQDTTITGVDDDTLTSIRVIE